MSDEQLKHFRFVIADCRLKNQLSLGKGANWQSEIANRQFLITHYSSLMTLFKVLADKAFSETESPRGCARFRTSMRCSARVPCRNRRAGRCRTGAGRDTIRKLLSAGHAQLFAFRETRS